MTQKEDDQVVDTIFTLICCGACWCCWLVSGVFVIFFGLGSVGLTVAGIVCISNETLCVSSHGGNIAMIVVGSIFLLISLMSTIVLCRKKGRRTMCTDI